MRERLGNYTSRRRTMHTHAARFPKADTLQQVHGKSTGSSHFNALAACRVDSFG